MATNSSFRSYVLDQLSRVAPRLRSRNMFGGVGIYDGELFFALIAGDTVYFKADDVNRPDYEARGLGPFRPFEDHDEVMSYYAVDVDTLEQVDELREWAGKAIDAARRKRSAPKKRAKAKRVAKKAKRRAQAKKSKPKRRR